MTDLIRNLFKAIDKIWQQKGGEKVNRATINCELTIFKCNFFISLP